MSDLNGVPRSSRGGSRRLLVVGFVLGVLAARALGARRRRAPTPNTVAYERQLWFAKLVRGLPMLAGLSRRAADGAFSSAESQPQIRRLLDFWSKETRKIAARRDEDTTGS